MPTSERDRDCGKRGLHLPRLLCPLFCRSVGQILHDSWDEGDGKDEAEDRGGGRTRGRFVALSSSAGSIQQS